MILHRQHQLILEELMLYEGQCFLATNPFNSAMKSRGSGQSLLQKYLSTRSGTFELAVPRTHSGLFRSQVIQRYQRRDASVR